MKKKKTKKVPKATKRVKKILEYYYMLPEALDVKALSGGISCVKEENIEIWKELNFMEVVLEHDSLIFQDATESFEDPLDLEFIREHGIKKIYHVSYDSEDSMTVKKILKKMMEENRGFFCCDTENFQPIYQLETIEQLGEEQDGK